MRWEYKVVKFGKTKFLASSVQAEPLEQLLNDLGREGWELVEATSSGVYQMNGELLLMFKRSRD